MRLNNIRSVFVSARIYIEDATSFLFGAGRHNAKVMSENIFFSVATDALFPSTLYFHSGAAPQHVACSRSCLERAGGATEKLHYISFVMLCSVTTFLQFFCLASAYNNFQPSIGFTAQRLQNTTPTISVRS